LSEAARLPAGPPASPSRAPGVRAAIALMLVSAIATSGLLRSFHAGTPRWPGLPDAVSSLLFTAFFLLLLLELAGRRRGLDLWSELPRPDEPTMAQLLPLVVVLLGEKWITSDLLTGAFDWIGPQSADPRLADALYRLWSGLGLLGAALALLPVLRQVYPRLAAFATPARLASALRLALAAWGVTTAVVFITGLLAGARLGVPAAAPGVLAAAIAAQVVRGVAEEFFYRGMLQNALVRVLARLGLDEHRLGRLTAIAAISASFTLEHVDPSSDLRRNLGALSFVFAMSVMLGLLLEASRNLYLVMIAHIALNLVLANLLPTFVDATGRPVLPGAVSGAIFVFVLFAGVVAGHRRRGFA
jgi:membrane protease YdiL (CAAX protease family)